VVPVEPRGVLNDHAVVVDKGRIVAIVPVTDAARSFEAKKRSTLDRHVLIPGS
jgi:5-methylthioadenosine/S-adenosylhomocysteine deaminase